MTTFAYVGCRTTQRRAARGKGISVYRIGAASECWELVALVEELENPSYLIVEATRGLLYAVHGDGAEVSAFRIAAREGLLSCIGKYSTGGRNPVHLSMTKNGSHLAVANYATGTVSALPVAADGSLGAPASVLALPGVAGPHRREQHGSHPHQVLRLHHSDCFVIPDKGADRIWTVTFDSAASEWQRQSLHEQHARAGAGPRHAALHPDGSTLYVVNELDSTLTSYDVTRDHCLSPRHVTPLLPESFTGESRAAGIAMDAASLTLFVSNRGHDSVTCIAIDRDSRLPAARHWISAGGTTPRFITLDADRRHLVVANETSDTIQLFPLHADGEPEPPGTPFIAARTGSPTCVAFYQTDYRSQTQ